MGKMRRKSKYGPAKQIEVRISPERIPEVTETQVSENVDLPENEEVSENVEISQDNEVVENVEEEENVEVTDIVEDSGRCKHPLANTWSFWLQANNKKDWQENLVELTSFDTVEDYWCLYHHMKLPSELQSGQDYAIFKKGIQPMWEDHHNRRGGRWLIMIEKGNLAKLDSFWLDTVLLMIGENFEDNDSITGVVVYIRPYSKIGVWTKDHKDRKTTLRIGHRLKSALGIRRVEYTPHNTPKVLYSV